MKRLTARCSAPLAAALVIVMAGLAVGDEARVAVRALLYGVVVVAGIINLRRVASPRSVIEFWIVAGSCALFAVSNGLRWARPEGDAGEVVNAAAGALLLLAGVIFIRHVRPGHGRQIVIDGLIVGLVAGLLLREYVVLTNPSSQSHNLTPVFLVVGLVGCSTWLRAVVGTRSVPVQTFAAAAVLAASGNVAVVIWGMGSARPRPVDLLTLLSTVLLVRAMSHPGLGRPPTTAPRPAALRPLGVIALLLALSALPGAVWARMAADRPPDLVLAVLLTALTSAWMLRFSQVLRDWEGRHQRLHDQVHTDPLTGVASRRRIMEHLDALLAGDDASTSVLFIDLDDFKSVNDRHGHRSGDELLVSLATRLADAFEGSGLVARLSGDEFAIVTAEDPGVARARVAAALQRPFVIGGDLEVAARLSIGATRVDPSTDTATDVLDRADQDMYREKHARRRVRSS